MVASIPPQLIALGAALSYAISGIAARRGMQFSTPITVTLVSVTVHAVTLWAAVLLTGGVPSVSWWALFLFALTGTLQPIIRLFTYAGIFYVGASRGTTLRSAHPLFSTGIAIVFLGEQISLPVIVGTLLIVAGITLISWQPDHQPASFSWWHVGYPLGAAFLAGISHPLRRYALGLANEPLYLAAVVGVVALPWLASYLVLPRKGEQPVWNRKCFAPFLIAAAFETLGILLVIIALSVGQVVIVSPIVATGPMWVLLGTWLFLRGIEQINLRTVVGTACVIAGTVAISVVR
ncbi:MAG TPA: DMT family transporter [Candidatus Udaeobacter sp.]|jgi:drug/metabolite transporter (DMT)-like permease|nr:DMT family transporter [Candidatus Udaeobacter sp.]